MFARRKRRPSPRGGFTLIEVLVAMVILAIGLLALEAMGIGAARMVARADQQSDYTALASAELENALNVYRQGGTVNADVRTVGPATVSRTVTTQAAVTTAGGLTINGVMVQVTVSPASGQNHLNFRPVTVVGRATR